MFIDIYRLPDQYHLVAIFVATAVAVGLTTRSGIFNILPPYVEACEADWVHLADPVYPGLFYKRLCQWLGELGFSSKSSQHLKFQTIRARQLKFLENNHLPPCVTYQVSHVGCQVSGTNLFIFLGGWGRDGDKVMEQVGGGFFLSTDLPRLAYKIFINIFFLPFNF